MARAGHAVWIVVAGAQGGPDLIGGKARGIAGSAPGGRVPASRRQLRRRSLRRRASRAACDPVASPRVERLRRSSRRRRRAARSSRGCAAGPGRARRAERRSCSAKRASSSRRSSLQLGDRRGDDRGVDSPCATQALGQLAAADSRAAPAARAPRRWTRRARSASRAPRLRSGFRRASPAAASHLLRHGSSLARICVFDLARDVRVLRAGSRARCPCPGRCARPCSCTRRRTSR